MKIPNVAAKSAKWGGETSTATISSRNNDVVDLTEDEGVGLQKPAAGPLKALPQFAAPAGGWVCTVCCVNNKPDSTKCAACQSPKSLNTSSSTSPLSGLFSKPATSSANSKSPALPPSGATASLRAQFAPPTGSWSVNRA